MLVKEARLVKESMARPPTTQEFVLQELRNAIVRGELPPRQPIRQDAIAQRFGVSRVPLREALKILEAEGQVVYRPHRGYSVAELALSDLLEVYRLRQLLESEAATVARGSSPKRTWRASSTRTTTSRRPRTKAKWRA